MEPLPHQLVNCKITTHTLPCCMHWVHPWRQPSSKSLSWLHIHSALRPCGTGSLDRSSPKSQGKPQHHDKTGMHTCPEQPKYPKHRYVQFWKLNYNHYKNWENKIKQMHSAFKSQCKTWKVPAWHITMLLDQTNRYPSSKTNFFRLGL